MRFEAVPLIIQQVLRLLLYAPNRSGDGPVVARQDGITEATGNTQRDGASTGGGAPPAKRGEKQLDGGARYCYRL